MPDHLKPSWKIHIINQYQKEVKQYPETNVQDYIKLQVRDPIALGNRSSLQAAHPSQYRCVMQATIT